MKLRPAHLYVQSMGPLHFYSSKNQVEQVGSRVTGYRQMEPLDSK